MGPILHNKNKALILNVIFIINYIQFKWLFIKTITKIKIQYNHCLKKQKDTKKVKIYNFQKLILINFFKKFLKFFFTKMVMILKIFLNDCGRVKIINPIFLKYDLKVMP